MVVGFAVKLCGMCQGRAKFGLEEGAGELWALSTELEEAVAAACGGLEECVALPHCDKLDEHSGERGNKCAGFQVAQIFGLRG